MNLSLLKDRHYGADVYVIGSGKSLEFFPVDMFDEEITIGVNSGWSNHLDHVTSMVTKYHALAMGWKDSDRVEGMVTTRGIRGHHHTYLEDIAESSLFIADHNDNPVERFTAAHWPEDTDHLVASHSTITTGMHLAAYMGASRIIVVAADCGVIDGEMNVIGHDKKETTLDTLRSFDKQNAIVKAELESRYQTHVVSLSPFVTPNMTGHTFESWAGRLDAR